MQYLVTYDVETADPRGARRLRLVARACTDYGQRVQNSVFECELTLAQLTLLKARLADIIEPATDSIRIYQLSRNKPTQVLGKQTAYDPLGALII